MIQEADPVREQSAPATPSQALILARLLLAAREAQITTLRELHAQGVDLSTPDEHGNAAIHVAAWFGHLAVLEVLHDCQAQLDAPNAAGFTAAQIAAYRGHSEFLRRLVTCMHSNLPT